jgi:hypothetical protein
MLRLQQKPPVPPAISVSAGFRFAAAGSEENTRGSKAR